MYVSPAARVSDGMVRFAEPNGKFCCEVDATMVPPSLTRWPLQYELSVGPKRPVARTTGVFAPVLSIGSGMSQVNVLPLPSAHVLSTVPFVVATQPFVLFGLE